MHPWDLGLSVPGGFGIGTGNRWDIYNLATGREVEGEEEPPRLWDHLNPAFLG